MQQEPRQVFISYSSTDSEKAKEFVHRLEGAGVSCWISQRDIPPGADFALEIQKAITNCEYYVILLSKAAQDSPYVMLELHQAFNQKKEIIPVLLENFDLNEKASFYLGAYNIVDATKEFDGAVKKIIKTLSSNLRISDTVSLDTAELRKKLYAKVFCPHCGRTCVKKQKSTTSDCLNDQTAFKKKFRILSFWRKNDKTTFVYGIIATMISLISMVCVLSVFISDNELDSELLMVRNVVIFGIALLLTTCLIGRFLEEYIGIYDMFNDVKTAMHSNELRYQRLKCAACEKEFGILVPADADLKELIPNLIETDTPK